MLIIISRIQVLRLLVGSWLKGSTSIKWILALYVLWERYARYMPLPISKDGQGSPKKQEREIFMELFTWFVGAVKSQICRAGWKDWKLRQDFYAPDSRQNSSQGNLNFCSQCLQIIEQSPPKLLSLIFSKSNSYICELQLPKHQHL